MSRDISLSGVRGIGPARLRVLKEAGIGTVRDAVLYLPKDYLDLSTPLPLAEAKAGESACFRVRVVGDVSMQRIRKLTIVKVFVTDGTETMQAVWYNQPWLKDQLPVGRELLLHGPVGIRRNVKQLISPVIEQEQRILPVYRPIRGLPRKVLRQTMEAALSVCEGQWEDDLPASIRMRYKLCERNFAMRNAHFPDSAEALKEARRRIAFEQLLLWQIAVGMLRQGVRTGIRIPVQRGAADRYWSLLSFQPTGAQKRVLNEIAEDLDAPGAMARMVQGDVGCGKTAVAFGAMYLAAQAGFQSVLMAPTDVLARQHYAAAQALFAPLGITVGLLTGSLTPKQHREAHAACADGSWQVVIGTHALITEGVTYINIGLVITDEQHRFGVRQRTVLSEKGEGPNVLVMSATPIPRSLSLILYGDLDISIVDELPPGRIPVRTRVVPEEKREDLYGFLRQEVARGRQAYVVCPLVEESEVLEARSAEQVYAHLKDHALPDLRIALVHGKQSAKEKDAALEAFRCGEIDILVSTTVIEVGVNVPNATVMVIENAERFGLAQLHQLRGRVGRGDAASWCFLMAEPNERLRFLTGTNDGFRIAQKDMELRGPGELFGERQSGPLDAGLSALAGDTSMLKITHDEARRILRSPGEEESAKLIALAREEFGSKTVPIN